MSNDLSSSGQRKPWKNPDDKISASQLISWIASSYVTISNSFAHCRARAPRPVVKTNTMATTTESGGISMTDLGEGIALHVLSFASPGSLRALCCTCRGGGSASSTPARPRVEGACVSTLESKVLSIHLVSNFQPAPLHRDMRDACRSSETYW